MNVMSKSKTNAVRYAFDSKSGFRLKRCACFFGFGSDLECFALHLIGEDDGTELAFAFGNRSFALNRLKIEATTISF